MNKSFRPSTAQRYLSNSEIDILESCERYEMVRLPDSLVPTTIFVGNLCEFVTDTMLSELFQKVSTLSSVPACVVRKPSGSSLKYGFVTFLNESEKEVRNSRTFLFFRIIYVICRCERLNCSMHIILNSIMCVFLTTTFFLYA
jgi:hypothetical protein